MTYHLPILFYYGMQAHSRIKLGVITGDFSLKTKTTNFYTCIKIYQIYLANLICNMYFSKLILIFVILILQSLYQKTCPFRLRAILNFQNIKVALNLIYSSAKPKLEFYHGYQNLTTSKIFYCPN